MTVAEKESTEVAVVEQKAASTELITIEPKKYVALVFEPFAKRYADGVDAVRNVVYDIKTTAGMATAVKFRALFRDIRTDSEKMRKLRKAPILEIGKLLDARQGDIEATSLPLEFLFDDEIDAEISRKEAIKVAQRRVEEERQKVVQAGIDSIKAYVVSVAGKSSADIDKASLELDFREITLEEFGDRTGEATQAKILTLEKLSDMYDEAIGREQEAQAAAELAEAERVARELAAEANRLESERLANLAREIEERDAAAKAEQDRKNKEAEDARAAADQEAADRRAEADRAAEAKRVAAQNILDDQAAALRARQEAADQARRDEEDRQRAEFQEKQDLINAAQSEIMGIQQQAIIASLGRAGVRTGGTIDCIRETLAETEAWTLEADRFGILFGAAVQAKADVISEIKALLLAAEEKEAARITEQAEADARRAAEEAAHAAEQKLRDAAPNLLIALEKMIDWACNVSDEYIDGEPGLRAEFAADMKAARAAIREATV